MVLLLIICCSFSSCSFRPAIDSTTGEVTSRAASSVIRTHGDWQFNRIKKRKKISHDPRYTEPVERVAKRLKQVIDMPDAEWEFVIFEDRSANAFALSGGKVGINTGLFKIVDNDALLAAVLGHEISHATANHSELRMYRTLGAIALGAALYAVLENNDVENPGYAVTGYALATYLIDTLPFSRKQEYESDKIGAIYMAKAGYDPRQAVELWKKLDAYHSQKNKTPQPEYLRTHPLDQSRIRALEEFMPVAMQHYKRAKPAP
ncbi:M48 family metallopeptidase [Verrucomicrobiaceae bacterium N1E253]|uniref:M48 family metallopeptidase n=1 Tax=Oceaniferula marina TaxID=2748318 RepID=A0A851GJ96_9BACT|nr:M48 family metallopeptidase [Oceaniferula marina]NWK54740.1 M48 family metallopeptidase [Oceaniferula marina]